MTLSRLSSSDAYARHARRNLWVALVLIVLLGAGALLLNAQPDGNATSHVGKAMLLLPLAIVIALLWLRSSRGSKSDTAAAEAVVLHDELRQLAMQRAFRAGFFGMLLCQPVLMLVFTWAPPAQAAAVMGSVTVLAGAAVFLGAFLLHDRD